ncbi:hypothetical protein M413DRAFT_267902 [Hebeloma cylindrosporum]|uniref:Uncharacterized protein n=1 Tax=Hebeloma cylindrosporum TaxID=76867 RepID=A0A0C2Z1F2_HEBCY|nr:hypothetical protein M413DRAFT_267902 [Hebeloma cylindrosporum h7]
MCAQRCVLIRMVCFFLEISYWAVCGLVLQKVPLFLSSLCLFRKCGKNLLLRRRPHAELGNQTHTTVDKNSAHKWRQWPSFASFFYRYQLTGNPFF